MKGLFSTVMIYFTVVPMQSFLVTNTQTKTPRALFPSPTRLFAGAFSINATVLSVFVLIATVLIIIVRFCKGRPPKEPKKEGAAPKAPKAKKETTSKKTTKKSSAFFLPLTQRHIDYILINDDGLRGC